jgi:hypothetical protein
MRKIILLLISLPSIAFGQVRVGSPITSNENILLGESFTYSSSGNTIAFIKANTSIISIYDVSSSAVSFSTNIDTGLFVDHNISLSGDGNILVAAMKPDAQNNANTFRIYKKSITGSWNQIGNDISAPLYSSCNSILSDDGSTFVVYSDENKNYNINFSIYKIVNDTITLAQESSASLNAIMLQPNLSMVYGNSSEWLLRISEDGNTIAFPTLLSADNYIYSVAVCSFKNQTNSWSQDVFQIPPTANNLKIDLSLDGNTMMVDELFPTVPPATYAVSKVKVYKRNAGVWTQFGQLPTEEYISSRMSISQDGNTLAVGDSYSYDRIGNCRIFKNIGNGWIQSHEIIGSVLSKTRPLFFGWDVGLSKTGNTIAASTIKFDTPYVDGLIAVFNLEQTLSTDSFVLDNFSIYPNPTSEKVTVNIDENLNLEKVNVYNTLGKLVKSENTKTINVSDLSKGNYYFEVLTNKGRATKVVHVN